SGAGFATFGDAPPPMMGTALPHIEPGLINATSEPVSLGDNGVLKLSGPTVAKRGIVGRSEKLSELGEFVTGVECIESPRNFFSFAP
ncbi:MAG: hypothetical protein GY771_02355, partial [bacterium]|nr:hypothetical protein [bacterium]